jgi:O-antigen ligase
VKSGISPESRDLLSNEYRDAENMNLEFTVRSSPLVGIGFGKEMIMKWPMPDISDQFAWYRLAPHNSILWLMMTIGISGFIVFWYFIGSAVVRALVLARRLPDRVDKGIAVYGVLMLAATLVFALLDQGLLSMRSLLFLGILLGAVFALPRLAGEADERGRES